MDKELAQQKIAELVEKYASQAEVHEQTDYNEAQTKIDFITPLFKILGWDIDNEKGLTQYLREVILEDRVRVDGRVKHPDYSFRLGNTILFYVEAKKPSVNIKDDKESALQLRHYGWNTGLTLSLLTNFREFAVYDCRVKPNPKDKAHVARLTYFTHRDLTEKQGVFGDLRDGFDFLWDTFTQENVSRGSFEKFIKDDGDRFKRGVLAVDQDFLRTLESWRIDLAQSLCRENKEITEQELNFIVPIILNRIIFLRMAEAREIEPYGELRKTIQTEGIHECYKKLYTLFQRADEKYNAGLFQLDEDPVSEKIIVPNRILKTIIGGLYENSPYAFEKIPVEILGSTYERFLGSVIRLTAAHRTKVEPKMEIRKAGGVYYTPQYIVDHIVKNTIDPLLKEKTPQEVARIKILDPACGSGSFLLRAYQRLLDWHTDYYKVNSPPSKGRKTDSLTPDGRLTTTEKKKILCNNIFGVDIDSIAVEVTKLSLLIKCMEGETTASIENTRRLFHEKILPNIDGNICVGNSLVESDFYQDKDISFWSDDDIRKINAFDWKKRFPTIFKSSGFDIVIGNPPWGQKAAKFSEHEKEYFAMKFPAASVGIPDLYRFFIEQSIILLKPDGIWGQVLPDIILLKNYETTRSFLLENVTLHSIDHWGKSFKQVNLESCTIIAQKGRARGSHSVKIGIHLKDESPIKHKIYQKFFSELPGKKFNLFLTDSAWSLLEKFASNRSFGEFFAVHEGIHSGNVREKLFVDKKLNAKCKKLILGRDEVQRYHLTWEKKWVHYTKEHFQKNDYAGLGKPEHFECAKLIIRRTGDYVLACIDEDGYYFSNNVFVCIPKNESIDMKIFLALLNSRLLTWYYRTVQPRVGKMFAEIKINLINDFPMPFGETLSASQKKICQRLLSLADQMLEAQIILRNPTWGADRKSTKQRIDILDSQLDALVYELYGLTAEEIAIVDGTS